MPIYHKTPPSIVGNHTTAEIDNHTSEAAKVKRTREHAYFNSYDFDAIEVLPYDEDEDEEEEGGKTKSKSANNTCLASATTTISQKQLKSKTHSQQHLSQTRQHLQPQQQHQPAKFPYQQQHHLVQQHPLAALKHSKTSSSHGNPNSSNSDNFIVDNLPHRSSSNGSGSSNIGKAAHKYNSYIQRFGVALFGGIGGAGGGAAAVNVLNTSKPSSLHQPSSSSSCTTSTSSSLAEDDSKHLKVISSDLSSSTTRAITPSSSSTSSTKTVSSSVAAVAESLNGGIGHRDVVDAANNIVAGVVNDITNGVAPAMATSALGCSTAAVSVAGSAAAAAAAADGNFLLPRAMLKYQSTLNGNGGHLATATTTSMPMAAATNAAATATAVAATSTGSSPASNISKATTATDGFATASTAILNSATGNNASRLKKHSTASSSLSSLGSEEIVEIHHVDIDNDGSKGTRKDSKVLPKLISGKTPGRAASHQSHYSTDKSASSGYYSSNVCSTYSLEEHIYSEPTIEVKEKPLGLKESVNGASIGTGGSSSNAAAASKPVEDALQHATLALATGETSGGSVMRTLDYNRRYRYTDHHHHNEGIVDTIQTLPAKRASKDFNENLRILESSIENLDRHLKSFPGAIPSQDAIVAYAQNPYQAEKMRSYAHLPTIREGYDNTAKRVWPEDPVTDDSLMDIDLDSFLLDDGKKEKKRSRNPPAKGIDNPSFLTEELEENHYKCAKYINSCPEDAYRVESDIIAPTRSSISEQSVAVSVDLYPKRYEDQIHFQNTRELLEDVRDKIRLLNLSQDPTQELVVSPKAEQLALEEPIPKELNTMISTLKRELELYLQRMNQHSELEIRQLCTGLVKNQHIVKMKNAFERRRSVTDGTEHISSYEALQGEMRALGGVPISIRQQVTTIKCSSDPNFKMKRKSLTEVFPISECYIETLELGPDNNPVLPPLTAIGGSSQLQRNLNFHQPNLQQFDTKTDNFEKAKNNGASGSSSGQVSGSPSGNDSSESNDKDSILDWHRKKPSIWEMYYGTNRIQQSLLGGNGKKNGLMVTTTTSTPSPMCYPSSRPESDFTLDLPRAEQLRIKMEKEKKFRQRCRVITTFLSLVFFLLTVMVVSLVLTRGKRMFGSMI